MDSEDETSSNASTLCTEELLEHYDSDTYSASEVPSTGSESSWNEYEDHDDDFDDVQSTCRYLDWKTILSAFPADTRVVEVQRPFRQTQRMTLLDLPEDVLVRIFTHLAPKAAVTFSHLCKQLYGVSQANRGRPWRLLIARQLGRNFAKLQKPKLSKLLAKYAWEICDAPHDHWGRRVKRYRKSDYRLCSSCRWKLDCAADGRDWNDFTRRHILKTSMAMYNITPRTDSKLCTNYIQDGEGYVPDIVKTMLRMHIIYDHSICRQLYQIEEQEWEAERRRRRAQWEAVNGPRQPRPEFDMREDDYGSGDDYSDNESYRSAGSDYYDRRDAQAEVDSFNEDMRETKSRREKIALRLYRRALKMRGQEEGAAEIDDCVCGRPLLQAYILDNREALEHMYDEEDEDEEEEGEGEEGDSEVAQ